MIPGYPPLPGSDGEQKSVELKLKTKVLVMAAITVLQAADSVSSALGGRMKDVKLFMTAVVWLLIAFIWFALAREWKSRKKSY